MTTTTATTRSIADKVASDSVIQQKFVTARREITAGLIERDEEVDILLAGVASGHHPLFVGDPGTGKSMLARSMSKWISGPDAYFEVLLDKFTDPANLFGPYSMVGLQNDEYRRVLDGTLATASVAFLDEIFKASTAILNTMLGVINERRYRNGREIVACPLQVAVAASNEWPQDNEQGGRELGALFDRFLLRKVVRPIRSAEGRSRLLRDKNLGVKLSETITPDELSTARDLVRNMPIDDATWEAVDDVIRALNEAGIEPGDRRLRWSMEAVRGHAFVQGSESVQREHLEILAHCLWVDPREQPAKVLGIVGKIANPEGLELSTLLSEVRQLTSALDPKKLENVLVTVSKLKEVAKKLKALRDNQKVSAARKYVSNCITDIQTAAVRSGQVD